MENKSFDDIIKSKLEQFSLEKDAADWNMLQEHMDQGNFDDVLREKIAGWGTIVPADAFDSFQAIQQDADFDQGINEALADFDSKEIPSDFDELFSESPSGFDALIGAKLAEVSITDGPDWDHFEKLLEGEAAFDEEVKNKVKDYEEAGSAQHWPKLSAHLENVERRRRRIVITKFIEAAVFILFFLSIMQLYPINEIGQKKVYRTVGVTESLRNSDVRGQERNLSNAPLEVAQQSEVNGVQRVGSEDNEIAERTIAFENVAQEKRIAERDDAGERATGFERVGNLSIPTLIVKSEKQRINPFEHRGDVVITDLGASSVDALEFDRNKVKLNAKKDRGTVQQPSVILASLALPELEPTKRSIKSPVLDFASHLKNGQYWFNIYGSPQINLINTPFDNSYSDNRAINTEEGLIEAYSHLADGYTLGASISNERANYEFEVGVEYSSLNYLPKQIKEITSNASVGYKETLLKEIIFDIVEIPMNIKYNLFKKKGWKVYGMNGASLGVVAFANYDIEEKISRPLASVAFGKTPSRNESSFVKNKDFNEGIVKTNDFLNNSFVTINVGLGVSKEISDQISFYMQPSYYHNLSEGGIGPNHDVHHRLAVQIGTKVRI